MRAHIRTIQSVSIVTLLLAASVMIAVSAHATERHSEHKHDYDSDKYNRMIERRHIHGQSEKYERPALHGDGTRYDDTYYPSDDDFEDELRARRDYYDDQEDE